MANPKPGPGRRIAKGQVLNPKGGGAHNPIKTRIKKLTVEELELVASLLLRRNVTEIKRLARDDNDSSSLRVWIANIIDRGIQSGAMGNLDAILDRVIGPVKQHIDLKTQNTTHNLADDQILKELQEINEVLKIKKE